MNNRSSQNPDPNKKTDFEEWYQTVPPWDIGHPQQVIIELERQKTLQGKILDVGCGTGENALFLAKKGYQLYGVDLSSTAIKKAHQKSTERNLKVNFKTHDALKLNLLGEMFDVALDCGLFHCFTDAERAIFVDQLYKVLTPQGFYFFLCFSDKEHREGGPRRISRTEIEATFSQSWKILSISETIFENTLHAGGSQGYFVSLQKA